jgi:hypothetical protein
MCLKSEGSDGWPFDTVKDDRGVSRGKRHAWQSAHMGQQARLQQLQHWCLLTRRQSSAQRCVARPALRQNLFNAPKAVRERASQYESTWLRESASRMSRAPPATRRTAILGLSSASIWISVLLSFTERFLICTGEQYTT